MDHQSQLEERKYRSWVKAGLGLKYTKEGLEPFCDQLVKQLHVDVLQKVRQKHNLSAVICGSCDIKTLQPDHVRTRYKQCPLGQTNCNCQYPRGKTSCSVCSAIYDEIIKLHASTPSSPYWKNTDAKYWCTEPWAVAKCFINAAGYEKKMKASEFDCSGLLHVLLNNMDFRDHLNCTTDGTDLLQKVLQHRNMIFHSHDMELEDEDVTTYVDDMIALLQDDKELINTKHSKAAVIKLEELKREDFVITTTNETEIRRAVMADVDHIKEEAEQHKNELEKKGKEVSDQIVETGTKQRTDLDQKEIYIKESINDEVTKGKTDLTEVGNQVKDQIVSTGTKLKADLEKDLIRVVTKQKTDLDQKYINIKENIRDVVTEGRTDLTEKGNQVKDEIVSTGTKLKADLERDLIAKTTKRQLELKQKREEKVNSDTTIETGQTQHGLDYNNKKTTFQKKLVDNYMQYVIKVSSLPLQPERNRTEIANLYASPWMTVEVWDEKSKQTKEIEITLDEIFSNEEKLSKYIYIIGEAGSGKSSLCKYLVNYWCIAHREFTATAIKSEAVKEMEKYDFLFYISLRHYSKSDTIENMLDEIYDDPILKTILQNESDKCLILLDGLDEWTPQNQRPSQFLTQGLPPRDINAKYTIITTTRRWKFDSLHITDSEIHKKIQLKGITGTATKHLTKTTVKQLNEIFHKKKVAEDFEPDLQRSPVADICHVPMILQQLICLWFDGKLRGTSKCNVYSSMLNLFFDWKTLKHSGNQVQRTSRLEIDSKLPEYLCTYKACCDNTSVIYYLASLAYKTMFNRNTKDTLTFSNSTFQHLKIPDDVKMRSLNAGILSEDLNISLFASTRQHSSFSFVHKSMQEFLAAVHIAMQFEKTIHISDASRKGCYNSEENCKQFIRYYFRDCKTVVDILEQSNVFIMLCGLEPKLLPYISEYIFNITKADEKMMEERIILQDYIYSHKIVLAESIQKCIVSCIKEASLEENFPQNSIYIADILLRPTDDLMPFLLRQIFKLHSVVSLNIKASSSYRDRDREHEFKIMTVALNLVADIKCLKAFKYSPMFSSGQLLDEQVSQIIRRNKTTLECVDLLHVSAQIAKGLVQIVPAMSPLISVAISLSPVSHEICTLLCTYLEQSVHLQDIRLDIYCEYDEHLINLAQHKHLQRLDIRNFPSLIYTSLNTNSLHTVKMEVDSSVTMNQLCNSLCNARKLKYLTLEACSIDFPFNADDYIDTESLTRLLPTLASLSTIELSGFTVTDNIITCPADMKNLKEIKLSDVTMSIITWYEFVDSLTKLPQNVRVLHYDSSSTHTDGSIGCYLLNVRFKDDRRQYVRGKTDSFRVTLDGISSFEFVSKKTEL